MLKTDGDPRDGKILLGSLQRSTTGQDVNIIRLEGDRKVVSLVHTEAQEFAPSLSPNGKWLAYESDESGRAEVYVTTFPGAELVHAGVVRVVSRGRPCGGRARLSLCGRLDQVPMAYSLRTAPPGN